MKNNKAIKQFLVILSVLFTGACAQPTYLQKFVAVAPSYEGALSGKKIYIEEFRDTVKVDEEWSESEAMEDPEGFELKDVTKAQLKEWKGRRDSLKAKISKEKYYKLGWQRNMWGMKIRDVMSVNDPASWLADALAVELLAQGVQLVSSATEADLVVGGTLAYINIDLYMATWCNLVVDLSVRPQLGEAKSQRIHTAAVQTAWDGGADESFDVLQKCEQRFSVHAISAVVKTLEMAAAVGAPSEPEAVSLLNVQ